MSMIDAAARRHGAPSRSGSRRRPWLPRRALTCCSAVALAVAVPLAVAAPAQAAAAPVYLGAAGDVQTMANRTGEPMATHAYAQFSSRVPSARMITVRASTSWRSVAAAGPGSAVYNDIVRWAQTIKSRPGPVLLAYHHEPEASGSASSGSAADFVAAYRHVVSVFRAQGVQNVEFTWQMTAYAFRAPAGDARTAARWYPGDGYVDVVGADAYNWSTCGHGNGKWVELSTLTDPVLAFAKAHGKRAALAEFAANPDSRRTQWLNNAHQYIAAHADVLTAAFYFNRGPTNKANQDCSWNLSTSAEYKAYGDIARDSSRFRT